MMSKLEYLGSIMDDHETIVDGYCVARKWHGMWFTCKHGIQWGRHDGGTCLCTLIAPKVGQHFNHWSFTTTTTIFDWLLGFVSPVLMDVLPKFHEFMKTAEKVCRNCKELLNCLPERIGRAKLRALCSSIPPMADSAQNVARSVHRPSIISPWLCMKIVINTQMFYHLSVPFRFGRS